MRKEIILENGLLFLRCKAYNVNTYYLPDSVDPFEIESCKHYVREHRNVFDSEQKLSVYSDTYPIMIEEISISPSGDKVSYWYWVFREDKYHVIKFDREPLDEEVEDAIDDIYKYEDKKVHYYVDE